MPRPSIAALAGALSCAFVPFAAQSQAAGLPEGAGRELVEGVCTGCHQTDQITRSSGYTQEGWKALTGTMIDLSASPEDREAITRYLAEHFPPNDKRAPTLVPGEARSPSRNGRFPRSASGRAIRWRRPTAPSGGPDNLATWSGGSTPRPAR